MEGINPETLNYEDVWTNPKFHFGLREFAVKILAEENIICLIELESLKEKGAISFEEGKRLMEEYIFDSSPMQINLTHNAKTKIIDHWSKVEKGEMELTLCLFDDAVVELHRIVETDLFPRWKSELIACAKEEKLVLPEGRKRVVVLGGGFTGITTARILDRMPRFHVTLIDSKEYFENTPVLVQEFFNPNVCSRRVLYRNVIKNGRFILAEVSKVTPTQVHAGNRVFDFDYLVVATGSQYSSHLRSANISTAYRLKKLHFEYQRLMNLKKILIIGGGLVGIELACEIMHAFPDKEVTIVEGNPRLLPRNPEKLAIAISRYLQNLGVEVITGERVISNDNGDGNIFVTDKGRKLYCDRCYIAQGPRPATDFMREHFSSELDRKGFIQVRPTLQIANHDNIFIGGDASAVAIEKLANTALVHGVEIARNICRIEKGKQPLRFGQKGFRKEANNLLLIVYLGGHNAAGILGDKGWTVSISPKWYDQKTKIGDATIRMIEGRVPMNERIFTRQPSILGIKKSRNTKNENNNKKEAISSSSTQQQQENKSVVVVSA